MTSAANSGAVTHAEPLTPRWSQGVMLLAVAALHAAALWKLSAEIPVTPLPAIAIDFAPLPDAVEPRTPEPDAPPAETPPAIEEPSPPPPEVETPPEAAASPEEVAVVVPVGSPPDSVPLPPQADEVLALPPPPPPRPLPKRVQKAVAPPKPKPTPPPPRPRAEPRPLTRPAPATPRQATAPRPAIPGPGAPAARPAAPCVSAAGYASLVAAELNRHKAYPESARASGASGAVGVAFTIGPSGRPTSISITRSSGNASLDSAARQAVASIRAPPPPNGIFRTATTIQFSLR